MDTRVFAIAAVIEAAAVVAAVIYAKRQLDELRDAREETTRPFVVLDLETWQTIATLKVRNIGQSIARNVSFSFSPPIKSTFDRRMGDGDSYVLAEIEMFANGIPSLAPGTEHSTLLDQVPTRLEAGLPNRYEVEVSFDAPNGRRYTDRQTLSLDTHIGLTRVERKGAHDSAKYLEDIAREVKRWSAFGAGSGLRIVTEADMQVRYERFLENQSEPEEPTEAEGDDPEDAKDGDGREEAA
jgi:hypothetical protein